MLSLGIKYYLRDLIWELRDVTVQINMLKRFCLFTVRPKIKQHMQSRIESGRK